MIQKNKYMLYKNCTIIKPNKKDAEHICNFSIKNIKDAYKACDIIVKKLNSKICIITLSEMGCVVVDNNNNTTHIPCTKIVKGQIMDVTGAGDTFISGLTLCLLHSIEIQKACEISNILCSDVVKRKQVSCVNLLDILLQYNNVITDTNNCYVLQKYLTNKKIIFTTGCFDLLHEGHIQVLKKAKELGDFLIVALNNDSSIKRLKGSNRPINNLSTRLAILSAIKYIDFIMTLYDPPSVIVELLH